ncbi:MAG: alpha/beta hydrolase [Ferruginibacter sp.]
MINETFVYIKGSKIAVKVSGEGTKTILCIHGNSLCSDMWLSQLTSRQLSKNYRLIAFDLPGHGQSGWVENTATGYKTKTMSLLVQDILNFYKTTSHVLVASSFGTNVIGEICTPTPGCKGIVLVSPCIVSNNLPPQVIFTGLPVPPVNVMGLPSENELQQFASVMAFNNKSVRENFILSFKKTDPAFREELGKSLLSNEWSDEVTNIATFKVPVCVIFGKEEKLIKTAYLNSFPSLWNNETILIENAGHLVNQEQPENFNKILASFTSEVFR